MYCNTNILSESFPSSSLFVHYFSLMRLQQQAGVHVSEKLLSKVSLFFQSGIPSLINFFLILILKIFKHTSTLSSLNVNEGMFSLSQNYFHNTASARFPVFLLCLHLSAITQYIIGTASIKSRLHNWPGILYQTRGFPPSSFPPSVKLRVPPLDSKMGWTGELWSKTKFLILEN